jgi:hypothetical protein
MAQAWEARYQWPDSQTVIRQSIAAMVQDGLGRPASAAEIAGLEAYLQQARQARRELHQHVAELRARRAKLDQELSALSAKGRERAILKLDSPSLTRAWPQPIAAWEFDDLQDAQGQLHGELHGDARLDGGALVVSGNGYFRSSPLKQALTAKTLQVWVQLATLEQRAGGVMTVQTNNGDVFDAVVYAEQAPQEWLPGSNGFVRTQSLGGPVETTATKELVCLTITYDDKGRISAYRNTEPYGQSYQANGVITYQAGEACVLFGLRHSPPGGNRFLQGKILRAQLFDRALEALEVMAIVSGDPHFVSRKEMLAALTEEERQQHAAFEEMQQAVQAELANIPAEDLNADPSKPWHDLALILFNLKEFIYLR